MSSIRQNITKVTQEICEACEKCGRCADSVQLLAVSKTKPVSAISEAIAAGQLAFGENYVQEGVDKIQHFAATKPDLALSWHFIGPIQSNKTRPVAEHFDWVHSVDRAKIARRLSEQRPDNLPPLKILLQVNTSGEASKSGVEFDELAALAAEIVSLPNLELRGLMSIPEKADDYNSQLSAFASLAQARDRLQQQLPETTLDTLSMGMSGDMEAAVAAGSTMVRIGTAIFGARNYS
ncbi:YggS family pyridoxal phosphate-dependent enzyme [Photobacterium sp. CCB-ST2H9]|uniref:YggS family pyridoxal phosphate-dependent enzyme n=1 Tax=Photobacterium sp. CCB-ST2H9 TaxID=2912855 RepID=UPI0020033D62|nr:YggS family pyridoxal phosphate-dependent enzyme [Photobacterium sp. CCB-ST2H9]UTM57765.1 YggS family pyridoxal phosphate-dependent enzyme [Photobacterium sp. CCB-ST2H9]